MLSSGVALLIAPSALHRLNFRMPHKRRVVFLSNNLVILGLAMLALAMTGVMLMIGDFLFGRVAGIAVAAVAATVFLMLWSVLPLRERRRSRLAP